MGKIEKLEDIYAKIALNGMPRLLSLLSQEQMQEALVLLTEIIGSISR